MAESFDTGTVAVVVSYNAASHLERCLRSMRDDGISRIVVADNGSVDGSRDVTEAAGATWLPTGANLGYGRAANLGAAHPALSGWERLLVANPDLHWRPGVVAALGDVLNGDGSVGAVGPRLSNPDGSLYPSARVFPDMVDAIGHGLFGMVAPRNRFTRRYRMLDWDHASRCEVEWVSGAFFMVRREAWDGIGGFDPAYFMYMEDVDLCWRLGRAGWKIVYEPAAEVTHVQGVSADRHPYRMLLAHHRSMWTFARRTSTGPRKVALPLVAVGLAGRLAVSAARRRLAGPSAGRGPAAGTANGPPSGGPLP